MKSHTLISVFFSLIFFITISKPAVADPVDSLKAMSIAKSFISGKFKADKNSRVSAINLKLIDAPSYVPQTNKRGRVASKGEKLYYIFNVNEDDGFVIVSGDDRIFPILAYSTQKSVSSSSENLGFLLYLDHYRKYLQFLKENDKNTSKSSDWDNQINSLKNNNSSYLIKTTWNQGYPYNKLTPKIDNINAVTGCTATAMAQLLKLYNYPENIYGGKAFYHTISEDNWLYFDKKSKPIEHQFNEAYKYKWSLMPNSIDENSDIESKNAVARLIADCGIACKSIYGLNGTSSNANDMVDGLKTFFGFDNSSKKIKPEGLGGTWTPKQISILKNEIDNSRPFFLRGDSGNNKGGHVFIIDGYQNDLFHINWGWGGWEDGYFQLLGLDPKNGAGGRFDFNFGQEAMINLKPKGQGCQYFFDKKEAIIESPYWYAPYAEYVTSRGLIKSVNQTFNPDTKVTIGMASESIFLAGVSLGLLDFEDLDDNPCTSSYPQDLYVDYFVNSGILNNEDYGNVDKPISLGKLARLIDKTLFVNNFPQAYRKGNWTQVKVDGNAQFKESILSVINIKGIFRDNKGRTKTEYTLAGFKDVTLSGNETVSNAAFSKFLANSHSFVFFRDFKLDLQSTEDSTFISKFRSDNYLEIGDKYENNNTNTSVLNPSTSEGRTYFLRSNENANFSFPTDVLSDGTKVHFYWSLEGALDTIKIEPTSPNFQSVKVTAPRISEEKVYSFYIYLGAENKRAAESYRDIHVMPNNPNGNPTLIKGEYFIDIDPGQNNGVPLFDNYTKYGIDDDFEVNTNNLSIGSHTLNIRVRDSKGNWSAIKTSTFEVKEPCVLTSATLSGTQTINEGQSATLSVSFTGASPWSFVVNGQTYNNISTNPYSFSVTPSQTTTYTLSSVSNACGTGTVSGSAVVTVNNCNVAPPITTGNSRCGTGTVMLSASNCGGTYNWYAAGSGGNSLGTASSYTTPSISTTTTYYVSCTVGNCTSTRAAAVATIGNIPSAPTIAPITINSGQTATLTASNCSGTVSWHSTATGSNFISSGASYTTPALTTTTTYYATCTVSGCESATRSSGTVTVTTSAFCFQKSWDKTIGGSNSDAAQAIIATTDGGFIVAGSSWSGISSDKTEANRGSSDYWVLKLNSTGQKIWDKTIGGSGDDQASSIVATSDGGFVITGWSDSGISGDKTEANKGGADYWIVKINSNGQKVWDKTIGGSSYERSHSIVATPDGGFVVAGWSNSGISGDKTEINKGLSGTDDYWIVKLNSNGQKVWDKTLGGSNNDDANEIIATSDGGFVVVGHSNSGISGDKTEASMGFNDYWIVKLNSNGQKVWDKTLGGSNNDYANSIVLASDGGFVVTGYSDSGVSGDKTEANKGGTDYWTIKLNSNGQKVWEKTLGGNNDDYASSITTTSEGGFVVLGYSSSVISGDKTEINKGGDDYWITKLNSNGQKVCDQTIGGNGYDYAESIIPSLDGRFVLAGWSNSGISGDKTEGSKGGSDFWIVKLGGCTPPAAPTVSSATINSGQTATLTASNCAGSVTWYNQQTDGTLLFTGNPYVTGALSANTTYYASCTVNNCESTTRGSGTVTINGSNPCPPTITHTGSIASGTYSASETIVSTANVPNNTKYYAGQSVTLSPGFSAGPNENFEIRIQGCTTTSSVQTPPPRID